VQRETKMIGMMMALIEKKAALIAGSVLVLVAASLVAWGILGFLLLQ